jgi:hypothetical protein
LHFAYAPAWQVNAQPLASQAESQMARLLSHDVGIALPHVRHVNVLALIDDEDGFRITLADNASESNVQISFKLRSPSSTSPS